MTHMESAAQIACESQIAVQVLLSAANDFIKLVPIKPHVPGEYVTPEEFTARHLRSVGVVGLNGMKPLCSWKEALPPAVMASIAEAFLAYLSVFIGQRISAEVESAELNRLYALPDTRVN